ncbi:protein phosphatase inhibitor 2-like [Mya arenaria]|uniref:protein phosphatase inhibitor 2-like n=1 Tax=Mya arenaria TaxID=6604 RepID=UPI0022E32E74|nr:protein phosphatase inhibitor 2-like [Mya arenaria]
MASCEKKRKGILKTSSSFDHPEPQPPKGKEMKWDEMNILATHHPPDKDYGHMKIDEPPTPYNKYSEGEEEDEEGNIQRRGSFGQSSVQNMDPANLTDKLEDIGGRRVRRVSTEEESSEEEEEDLTPEELQHKKGFQQKRKLHYNEFQAVQIAKQLMAEEDDDDDDEGVENPGSNTEDSVQMAVDSDTTREEAGEASTKERQEDEGKSQRTSLTTVDELGHLETQIN